MSDLERCCAQKAELPWKEKGLGFSLPSLKLPDFSGGFDSLAEDFKASHPNEARAGSTLHVFCAQGLISLAKTGSRCHRVVCSAVQASNICPWTYLYI